MTGKTEFSSGDECWTQHGLKARYFGCVDGQHLVRLVRVAEDYHDEHGDVQGEYEEDEIKVYHRVFKSPPECVRSGVVKREQEEVDDLLKRQAALNNEISELTDKLQSLHRAISRWPDLSLAVDFLEGRITHVVEEPQYGSPKIMTLSECLDTKDDHDRSRGHLRLVSLFGTKNRSSWHVSRYHDGSGSWAEITPCRSLEEAHEVVSTSFHKHVAAWRADNKQLYKLMDKSWSHLGLVFPNDVIAAIKEKRRETRDARIEELQKQISVLQVDD